MQWLTTRVKLGKLRDALTNNNPLYDNVPINTWF